MLVKLSFESKKEMQQWDDFVQAHPHGSPYHLSDWLRSICETYHFEPLLYAESFSQGRLAGVLPFIKVRTLGIKSRLVSIPFSDVGGPLFLNDDLSKKALQEVLEAHGRKVSCIEIRCSGPSDLGFVCLNYYRNHVLDLRGEMGEIRRKVDKRTIQYNIRKAERLGVEIVEDSSRSGMEEFRKLNIMTRKKHGVPGQPKAFFDNLLKYMIEKGHGFILLGVHKSRVIGASVFLRFCKVVHYKYNASDPEYLKEVSPNHSLTWHAIRWAHEHGYERFDFGRAAPDNEGLMRYKKMWGCEVVDLPYCYYPKIVGASATSETSKMYRFLTKAWRVLPDSVAERLGGGMYKYMS